jgi:hypothetical protein
MNENQRRIAAPFSFIAFARSVEPISTLLPSSKKKKEERRKKEDKNFFLSFLPSFLPFFLPPKMEGRGDI